MDADAWTARASSFGGRAELYAEARPGYPDEAVRWLVGTTPCRVLELGAGTGKLTRALTAIGHDVVACEPSAEMLQVLRRTAPTARPVAARAEQIPLPAGSVDVVVAAQAYHWFDTDRALPEIARVLRSGGALALVWNTADRSVPWVGRLLDRLRAEDVTAADPLAGSPLFSPSEHFVRRHWQQVDKASLRGLAESHSTYAVMPGDEQAEVLSFVEALYDSYGRGPDGMSLPYLARCFRARVSDRAGQFPGMRQHASADDGLVLDLP